MDGWIKIHRKFLKWEWYDDITTMKVFLHLLLTANHKDKRWHGILIKRGQRLISIRGLARETRISVRGIRTILNRLKSTHEITQQSTQSYTMITICNYETYQCNGNASDTPIDTVSDKRPTHDRHTTDTKQECKERKNDKKVYSEFVLLTDEEHKKLLDKLGEKTTQDYIDRLSFYIGSKGKRYKSHYHTIMMWYSKDEREGRQSAKTKLFPIAGRTCSKPNCSLPAVYKSSQGEYDSYYCSDHLPPKVKERYE